MRVLYMCLLISVTLSARATTASQSTPQTPDKTTSGTPVTSIAISAFHDSVKAGSPVTIIVTLTNTSAHDIWVTRLLSGADSKIDVRDLAGRLAPDTGFGYIRNGHVAQSEMDETRFSAKDLRDSVIGSTAKAGQTTAWEINVGRFYDMSQPGKYSIRIERPDPEAPNVIIKSNTVTVTVTAP